MAYIELIVLIFTKREKVQNLKYQGNIHEAHWYGNITVVILLQICRNSSKALLEVNR